MSKIRFTKKHWFGDAIFDLIAICVLASLLLLSIWVVLTQLLFAGRIKEAQVERGYDFVEEVYIISAPISDANEPDIVVYSNLNNELCAATLEPDSGIMDLSSISCEDNKNANQVFVEFRNEEIKEINRS